MRVSRLKPLAEILVLPLPIQSTEITGAEGDFRIERHKDIVIPIPGVAVFIIRSPGVYELLKFRVFNFHAFFLLFLAKVVLKPKNESY